MAADYTNGRPFLLTHTKTVGLYSRDLHYLLPDGRRRKVTIDTALDQPSLRQRIGEALAAGRTGRLPGGRTSGQDIDV